MVNNFCDSKNVIDGAIYYNVIDYFSVSAHLFVTSDKVFLGNIVTTVERV